jgi:hypothetical protein
MTDQTPEAPNTQTPHTQAPEPKPPEQQPNEEQENRGNPPGYGNGEVTGAGAGEPHGGTR